MSVTLAAAGNAQATGLPLTRRAMSYWAMWRRADLRGREQLTRGLHPDEAAALNRLEANICALGHLRAGFQVSNVAWEASPGFVARLLEGLTLDARGVPDLTRSLEAIGTLCREALERALKAHLGVTEQPPARPVDAFAGLTKVAEKIRLPEPSWREHSPPVSVRTAREREADGAPNREAEVLPAAPVLRMREGETKGAAIERMLRESGIDLLNDTPGTELRAAIAEATGASRLSINARLSELRTRLLLAARRAGADEEREEHEGEERRMETMTRDETQEPAAQNGANAPTGVRMDGRGTGLLPGETKAAATIRLLREYCPDLDLNLHQPPRVVREEVAAAIDSTEGAVTAAVYAYRNGKVRTPASAAPPAPEPLSEPLSEAPPEATAEEQAPADAAPELADGLLENASEELETEEARDRRAAESETLFWKTQCEEAAARRVVAEAHGREAEQRAEAAGRERDEADLRARTMRCEINDLRAVVASLQNDDKPVIREVERPVRPPADFGQRRAALGLAYDLISEDRTAIVPLTGITPLDRLALVRYALSLAEDVLRVPEWVPLAGQEGVP